MFTIFSWDFIIVHVFRQKNKIASEQVSNLGSSSSTQVGGLFGNRFTAIGCGGNEK